MSQLMVSYCDAKTNTVIDVLKDDEKNLYVFAINDGQDRLGFRSYPTYVPHIANLDANGYRKFLEVCDRLGTPSTLTLMLGNEMRPSETHYILIIPDLFTGRDTHIRLDHAAPLCNEESVRIVTERLNKKICDKDVVINRQASQIETLNNRIADLTRRLNHLEECVISAGFRSNISSSFR